VFAALQVGAAAIEIWTMDDGYFFDNVVVSNSEDEAAQVREDKWAPKKALEVGASSAAWGFLLS
jgi:calnexin